VQPSITPSTSPSASPFSSPKTKKEFTFYCVHQIYSDKAECVAKNVHKYEWEYGGKQSTWEISIGRVLVSVSTPLCQTHCSNLTYNSSNIRWLFLRSSQFPWTRPEKWRTPNGIYLGFPFLSSLWRLRPKIRTFSFQLWSRKSESSDRASWM